MSQSNGLISFLRHYGPIPAGDNMYDELIQEEIERHAIDPVIHISPAKLDEVKNNFESAKPRNVVLTGTAGDGKTFHCRQIWIAFGGDPDHWNAGEKVVSLTLPASRKTLIIVKDLSELTHEEKTNVFNGLAHAVTDASAENIYLVAANDGQLLASWRDWSDNQGEQEHRIFKTVEDMLVEERIEDESLNLYLFNLSRLDASSHFHEIIEQIVEHPQWSNCAGCDLLGDDGSTTCPIRLNRERLRKSGDGEVFRKRLGELMTLARANRMHVPIRDLLLLSVNVLLGDRQSGRILLTCRSVHIPAHHEHLFRTNVNTDSGST